MNRDERLQLRNKISEITGWMEAAATADQQRIKIIGSANAAEAAFRRSIREIRLKDNRWRILPLKMADEQRLRDIARCTSLPQASKTLAEALVDLNASVPAAVHDARALTGAQRFFRGGTSRERGRDAAEYLTQYREWFRQVGLPDALNRYCAGVGQAPPVVNSKALADHIGLRSRLGDLGANAELLPAAMFAELPQALQTVQSAAVEHDRCRAAALEAGNAIRTAETQRMVAEMGVDRLRDATRDKIRTAPLTEAGLTTVKAVLDHNSLENLPGIGATSATRMRAAARTLWQTTYDEMPVRIDIKRRSPETTELLRRLRTWDAVRKNMGGTDDLDRAAQLGDLAKSIDGWLTHLIVFSNADSPLQDFRAAVEAVRRRAQLLSTAVGGSSPSTDPWDDFLSRPADYFALLAELGFITEDPEKVHGDLPDEIVEAVRSLELKTEHLRASLRGYQSFGARFALVQRKVVIGDEMGLGKTVEAIAVLAHLRAKGSHHFLVICPAAVVTNWIREISSKSKLPAHRLHGPDREFAAKQWQNRGGVAVTTFESLNWLRANVRGLEDLGCITIDEAHYIKNPDAQRTRNTSQLLATCDRAVLLTGTPLENRIDEFRNLVSYIQPNLVVDANELAPRRFRRQVAPAYLRRNQEDVLTELPDLVEVDEWLSMSNEDSIAYRDAVAAGNFMAMRQAAMLQGKKSLKLQRLFEIVEEAEDNGRRVVVFSYFREVLDQVSRSMPGRVFGPLTGSVAAVKRQVMVDQFSAAGGGAVLVAQVVAGGVGLNIQAASVVVMCEPQLKPTTEWQAIARARRMGQLESVQVHRLLSEDGVDQRIREILARKSALFEEFARESETAKSAPEAYDVTEAELAREVIAAERERLFGQTSGTAPSRTQRASGDLRDSKRAAAETQEPDSGVKDREFIPIKHQRQPPAQGIASSTNNSSPSAERLETSALPSGGQANSTAGSEGVQLISRTTQHASTDRVEARLSNRTSPAVLKPYKSFDEPLPAPDSTPLGVIASNVVRIVKAEGPVTGWRLHEIYRRSFPNNGPPGNYARMVNRGISLAERRGLIKSENPLKQEGVKPKTFRLPSQPGVDPRELGPRPVHFVPPSELAHHVAALCELDQPPSESELFQMIRERLGLMELTEEARTALRGARALASAERSRANRKLERTDAAAVRKQAVPDFGLKGTSADKRRRPIKVEQRGANGQAGVQPPGSSPFYDADFVRKHQLK